MSRAKSNGILPALSLAVSAIALAIAFWSLWETRQQDRRMLSSSLDFAIADDDREKTVGIGIINTGPAPARIEAIRYYVDGKQVKDAEEAASVGKLDPDTLTSIDLSAGSTVGVGETIYLFSRSTKSRKELDRFLDFMEGHLAIYARSCSIAHECADKCSADDERKCMMPVAKREEPSFSLPLPNEAEVNDSGRFVIAVLPIAALILSFISLSFSRRALGISEAQEKRKQPRLDPHLIDSYFEPVEGGGRVYSFHLSLRNPSDSNNAIAQIEMRVRYTLEDATQITAKLSPTPIKDADESRDRLSAPRSVPAHDTVSGWCAFTIGTKILNGRPIDNYQIILTDSHQITVVVDLHVVQEKKANA